MCGIFLSLSRTGYNTPDLSTTQLLNNRGPDSHGLYQTIIRGHQPYEASNLHATFLSTVLSLRGASIVNQPLRDEATGSALCWNGEAWRIGPHAIEGNDSRHIFDLLLNACSTAPNETRSLSLEQVRIAISSIRGPFAFVFYDARNQYIYYGRDCLGRRSLMRKLTADDELILSSVCDNTQGGTWNEVDADGIYAVDLVTYFSQGILETIHIPQRHTAASELLDSSSDQPFPIINSDIPVTNQCATLEQVHQLCEELRKSLELRIQHVRESVRKQSRHSVASPAKVAILFSGGLDCTLLARLVHDILPSTEAIDLLNVAFENPRIHSNLEEGISPYELCPDRITGRSSFAELVQVCPERPWRFVEINVPIGETMAHRSRVVTLMYPHNTEMDLSISYALYFASRGTGFVRTSCKAPPELYSTTAYVLLSGLGADELFGGYQRHATAFSRLGYRGLIDELDLDFSRIGKRNLGRDDRVISDSGREVRFPYLDEDFIAFALKLPIWAKCDFGNAYSADSTDPHRFLEPGKRILRLLAWELDLKRAAAEKKRAIQFGARTAKMETGKSKGTQLLT